MLIDPEAVREQRRTRRVAAVPAPSPEPQQLTVAEATERLLDRIRSDDPHADAALMLGELRDGRPLDEIAARRGLAVHQVREAIDAELARRGRPCLAELDREAAEARARWQATRRRTPNPAPAAADALSPAAGAHRHDVGAP